MCIRTGHLKLCTCNFGGDFPDNYWVLHRFNSKKDELIVGEAICNYKDPITEATICAFILASLNNADCFDQGVMIKSNDILQINVAHNNENFNYCYKYSRGKWREAKNLDAFELISRYDEVRQGIM